MTKKRNYIIPIFIPELACPFQCVFCNQKKISGSISAPSVDEMNTTIDKHLSTIDYKNNHVEIAFFGGNFTGINIQEQEHYLRAVQQYIKGGIVNSIRLSTRPDYINPDNLEMLKRYSVKTIELGAQSFHDDVLQKSGRGHKVADIISSSGLIKEMGFQLGLQMMIGLPGDTKDKSIRTAHNIIKLGADSTRIYPTLVIRGTTLERLMNEGKYTPLTLDEAVSWTKELLILFKKNNVTVLRIGLHPSEGLLSGHELIAGPFHQSFRELVMTEIWHDKLKPLINKPGGQTISIHVNKDEINSAIGYSGKNRKMLETNFSRVNFICGNEIQKGEFIVNYC